MAAFLKNMILRPACYQCKTRDLRSNSDITLGDYWGIDSVRPEMNDHNGISIVLVNTEKGKHTLESKYLRYEETSFEDGFRGNPAIIKSAKPWHSREDFFLKLDSTDSVISLIREKLKPTPKMIRVEKIQKIKYLPKRFIKEFMRLIWG